MMRIITGSARGTRLQTLKGEATRPTSERAKEAIFSMIQFKIAGAEVLDLFAGSGQLALEALSRGAAHAVIADSSAAAVETIKNNSVRTRLNDRCTVYRADHRETVARLSGCRRFDLVFLDPPYKKGLIGESLELLLGHKVLSPRAIVICESEDADILSSPSLQDKYEVIKITKYGIARITLLRPAVGMEQIGIY